MSASSRTHGGRYISLVTIDRSRKLLAVKRLCLLPALFAVRSDQTYFRLLSNASALFGITLRTLGTTVFAVVAANGIVIRTAPVATSVQFAARLTRFAMTLIRTHLIGHIAEVFMGETIANGIEVLIVRGRVRYRHSCAIARSFLDVACRTLRTAVIAVRTANSVHQRTAAVLPGAQFAARSI